MSTSDYFTQELEVSFTLNQLYQISSALATEHFNESSEGRSYNAEVAWRLRKKVQSFINKYDNK